MKKRGAVFLFAAVIAAGLCYLQNGRDAKVISSIVNSSGSYCEQDLTIVANKLFILDKEKFAEKMIQRCVHNDFHEMKFSYDRLGYPNRIEITVYLNEMDRTFIHHSFWNKYGYDWELQLSCNEKESPQEK